MNGLVRLGLVVGGYLVACLVARAAVTIYQAFTLSAASQASAGMSAFGDFLLFVGVFAILALFPTGSALYFLIKGFRAR